MALESTLINKLQEGPAILFLGQDYLSVTSGKNILLDSISKKFKADVDENRNYDLLFKLPGVEHESLFSWLEQLCKDLNGPLWLDTIVRIPWSAVFTSAIDTILERAFTLEWRKVQPVFDERYKVLDPRNKHNLHLTHCFGGISQIDSDKKVPSTIFEKSRRNTVAVNLLQRIPETVTPKGVFLIEGFGEFDWLKIEDFYAVVSRLANEQTYIFSASDSFLKNPFISDLISHKKVVVMKGSLANFIVEAEQSDRLSITVPEPQNYLGRWLSIENRKIKVPSELINKVARSGIVITDDLFEAEHTLDADDKYAEFRKFLSTSGIIPDWTGYPRDFAFAREYFQPLLKKVQEAIQLDKNNLPIILYGQASSGKTISLGQLTYVISQRMKIPVLFIEKRYQKTDELEIDNFCRWCEENKASKTIIVWDGMVEVDNYYQLINRLNARGRNVVLIGSSYVPVDRLTRDANFIECPIELSGTEKTNFAAFIQKIDPSLSTILANIDDKNFLSMLYRYIPYTRGTIKTGLKSELDFFSKALREVSIDTSRLGPIGEALINAGVVEKNAEKLFSDYQKVDGEEINISDKLIYSIIVPGEYGLNVPFELLLRTIGYEIFSSQLFQVLNSVNLIKWIEDYQGNISVGARTAIEARILAQYLGSRRAKVEYLKILLKEVKSNAFDHYFESNPEIQFAVELLNNVGPNSQFPLKDHYYELSQVLRQLRESKQAYHPRLILKEALFIREIVKGDLECLETHTVMLDRAEEIIREVLNRLKGFRERTITSYLRNELASILGTKTIENIDEQEYDDALSNYEMVKLMNHAQFAVNPDNYRALDILTWTTKALIKNNVLSDEERVRVEADIMHLFELAESEGVNDLHREEFYKRKMEIYELVGQEEKANRAFQQLMESGSTLGFYIRAKQLLGEFKAGTPTTPDREKNMEVIKYLHEHFEAIKDDGRCVHLLLKCWWVLRTNSELFSQEKQALPFSKSDWEFSMTLIEHLLSISDMYYTASILYLKGVTEFHIGRIKECLETFKVLDFESDFSSYGRKRVIKTYLASTYEGRPRQFFGEVRRTVSQLKNEKIGEIYISELREHVPFILGEFGRSSFQSGEKIERLLIGFNFRGPIAMPLSLLEK